MQPSLSLGHCRFVLDVTVDEGMESALSQQALFWWWKSLPGKMDVCDGELAARSQSA
jgi:hypothetical protein